MYICYIDNRRYRLSLENTAQVKGEYFTWRGRYYQLSIEKTIHYFYIIHQEADLTEINLLVDQS